MRSGNQEQICVKFWERCITESMFLRGRCLQRPSLYYTEEGSVILDARPFNTDDTGVLFSVYVICDQVAEMYGYTLNESLCELAFYVWQKLKKEV